MNKLFFLLMSLASLGGLAQQKNAKYQIDVNGVCNSCKMRIEKAALGVKGVKFAKWSVENHQLMLIIDERKSNIDSVQSAVARAGHDNTNPLTQKAVTATESQYGSVADCCKYRDEEVVKNHP